jgi:hypothetical protein
LTHILYRLVCIVLLAPFAFLMMSFTHLFAWMIDVVNIPLEIDRLLTATQEEEPEENSED